MDDKIKSNFSRHIAKVMAYLEASGSSNASKKLIKTELWFLYDDVINTTKQHWK